MQITKTNLILGGIIAILLLIIYWQSGEDIVYKDKIVYKIAEQKSDFKTQTPKEVKPEIKYIDTIIYKDKKEVTDETVPKDWLKKFIDAQNNSTKTLSLYQDAIRKRIFTDRWEDDNFIVDLEAEAYGKIDNWKPIITQKAKNIEIPIEIKVNPKVNYYGGVELSNPTTEFKPGVKVTGYIQNPKGNLYSFGVDNRKNLYAGKIFKFN